MTRARLVACLLVAALPLAGCGNKGPLIRVPDAVDLPPAESAATMPAAAGTLVFPSDNGTVAPPSASTINGTPR
jgi:predicted small lipoprotein YifL